MKTRIPIFCMIILSLVVFIPDSSACSCAAGRTIEDSFSEADNVIFSGTVTGIKEQQRTFLVTFEIDESWKGIPNDVTEIKTMTAQSSATCGYNFEDKKSYLVEAFGMWDQTPVVSICDSTTLLDSAHEQVSFLNKQTVDDFGKTNSSTNYQLDESFEIKMNQTIQFEDLELHFRDIEDSRCPLDVTCIWEGNVTVMINIQNQTHKNAAYFTPGFTSTYHIPYEITLVDIQPHPISTQDATDKYIATLRISKSEDNSESFQKGETLGDYTAILGWGGLAGSLVIVAAYIIMKKKKRNGK